MGYLNGYADREYLEDALPKFSLPMLSGAGKYRAFEVGGDEMLPVAKGTVIVARFVEQWDTIKGGTPCILVSQANGIQFRRLYPLKDGFCLLHDHPASAPKSERMDTALFEDILEIWEAKSYISSTFPIVRPSLDRLASLALDLQQQVANLKKH